MYRNISNFENDKYIESFTVEEKNELFNDLMEMYFKKNFGTISKTDFETYIFSFYVNHLEKNNVIFDDYSLGKDLGITQAKVRSLRERRELKYPSDYNWIDEFLRYAENAKYDENSRLIKFIISDVNVIKDARHFFETNGYYDEFQLNPKLFQCTSEAFIEISKLLCKDRQQDFELIPSEIKPLQDYIENKKCNEKEASAIKKIINNSVEQGLSELLVNGSKELILFVLGLLRPSAGIPQIIISIIIKAISNKLNERG